MTTLAALQSATLAARARTGDPHLGTQIGAGLVDVVRAVPPAKGRGRYTVTVLRPGLTMPAALAYLAALPHP